MKNELHVLKILIKYQVNEIKRKIIHMLGGYTDTEMNIKLDQGIRSYITKYHIQDLKAYFCIKRAKLKDLGPEDIADIKRKICHAFADRLEPFVEFSLFRLDDPDSEIATIIGSMRLLVPEHGGELDLGLSDWHAEWQPLFNAKVDRGGDRQP